VKHFGMLFRAPSRCSGQYDSDSSSKYGTAAAPDLKVTSYFRTTIMKLWWILAAGQGKRRTDPAESSFANAEAFRRILVLNLLLLFVTSWTSSWDVPYFA
jgi:hypothetical protein